MPRCVNCGATIDDEQAKRFNGLCPDCVRAHANPDKKDDLAFESGIWALIMFFGIAVMVVSIGSAFLLIRWTYYMPSDILAMILIGAAAGVIIGYGIYYFGHKQQIKAKAKLDAATHGQNA